jgi:hypothetical protein
MAFNQTTFEIETEKDELHMKLGKEDWAEIVINKELHLHLVRSTDGYVVDIYRYNPEGIGGYDDDLIDSKCVFDDDLTKFVEVETVSTDGTDEVSETSYRLLGGKLYYEDDTEPVCDNIDIEEDVTNFILNYEHDHVKSISIDDEEIYTDDEE